MRRFLVFFKKLWSIPGLVRIVFTYVDAETDVNRGDYISAEKKLLRIYELSPKVLNYLGPTPLLLSFVSLRLGNPAAAAELVPVAIEQIKSLHNAYANDAERAYLRYVGKLIYQEATRRIGVPASIDVGVEYDDLDVGRVRNSLMSTFPLPNPNVADIRHLH